MTGKRLVSKKDSGIPTSTGFGESKVFTAPEGTFEDPTEKWTVNGEPIPFHLRHAIPYENTDQGREERQQKIMDNGGPARSEFLGEKIEVPGGFRATGEYTPAQTIRVDGEQIGKTMLHMADDLKDGKQPWETADAMRDIAAPYQAAGRRVRYLSPHQIEKGRGLRGWEPTRKDNGDTVKCGNMILGWMPEDKAQKRDAHFSGLARQQMVDAQEQVQAQSEQIAKLSKVERISGKNGEARTVGYERVRGDAREMDDKDFDD